MSVHGITVDHKFIVNFQSIPYNRVEVSACYKICCASWKGEMKKKIVIETNKQKFTFVKEKQNKKKLLK